MSLHLEHLNPEQLAAVTLPDEHALVLAGAGSGKTRVLTTRIAWLIKSGKVTPGGVLAVTFTNKAAREMYTRLSAMLPLNPRGMWIGTFHGLCNRMLRAHHQEAGLPREFQILDQQDQLAAIKRLIKGARSGLSQPHVFKFRTAGMEAIAYGDDDQSNARRIQHFISSAKEEGRRSSDIELVDDYSRAMADWYAAYDEQCRREGVVDFAELLLRSYELLARNEILREHYRARFRHILVDEFQDTNRLQYRWLKFLAGPGASLFGVGDDDQSIYAFRGANVGNMADFEREFAIRRVIRLEQNYRSHGTILDAANALIANNRKRLGKNLWTASGRGEPVRVYEGQSDAEEARFIADEVEALGREGTRLAEIAVLYRSNAQSRVLEHALFGARLPYRVYGGLRFFERAEVKHALAYLRLVASPDDDNAFLRVANFPPRGIGARSMEALQDAARARASSLWRAMDALSGRAAQSLAALRSLIESLRAETGALPLAEKVEHVVARSGLIEHYKAEREGADRIENLGELVNAAAAFDSEDRNTGLETGEGDAAADAVHAVEPLSAFLRHAALEAGEHQAGDGQDALQLMTVHSAKGLEFNAVFLSGLEEGLFPHEQALVEKDGLEEERRLAYVAITRARSRLYLSFAQTRMLHGQTRYHLASRFLEEVPEGLKKWLTPRLANERKQAFASPASSAYAAPKRIERGFRAGAERSAGFRIGQNVTHPKFGDGVVIDAEGHGNDARVQVNFGKLGVKWLAVAVAKLEGA